MITTCFFFSILNRLTISYHNTAPDDYTSVNTSFVFVTGTARDGPGSRMCVDIAIINDPLVEFDEHFPVVAVSADPNIIIDFLFVFVVIIDDDGELKRFIEYSS